MFPKALAIVAVLSAALLAGCGTSTPGSRANTLNGVSESGYPGGAQPKDSGSPALGSSTEQAHSNPIPKVPEAEGEANHAEAAKPVKN
ncbi:MAG TPA: hypothetical protein VNH18_22110 [Bryobacteraceae bacterium]|nr:hypothetical protein [Bryobacteraceae bacterium]